MVEVTTNPLAKKLREYKAYWTNYGVIYVKK